MFRYVRPLAVVAVLAGFFFAGPSRADAEIFSVRLSYGAAHIAPSDLNDFLADFVRARRDAGYSLTGGLRSLDWSNEFEVAFRVPLSARLSVLASAGLIGAEQSANDFGFATDSGTGNYTRTDRIRSIAVRLGLAYAVPLSGRLTLRPHAGLDGYWTSFQDSGGAFFGLSGWEPQAEWEWTANTNAFNFGYTLGVGLDIALGSRLSVGLDAGWRGAKLTGFEGKIQVIQAGLAADPQNIRVSFSRESIPGLNGDYAALNLPFLWPGGMIKGTRDAVLDLSGIYGSAGLKISF